MNLVSHADARHQLRLDEPSSGQDGADDPWLDIWIPAVSAAIAQWLKDEWRLYVPAEDSNGPLEDSNGDPIPSDVVQPNVRAACLVELSSQFRFREGEGENMVEAHEGHGYILSKGATRLLVGLRKTTVA